MTLFAQIDMSQIPDSWPGLLLAAAFIGILYARQVGEFLLSQLGGFSKLKISSEQKRLDWTLDQAEKSKAEADASQAKLIARLELEIEGHKTTIEARDAEIRRQAEVISEQRDEAAQLRGWVTEAELKAERYLEDRNQLVRAWRLVEERPEKLKLIAAWASLQHHERARRGQHHSLPGTADTLTIEQIERTLEEESSEASAD